MDLPNPGLSRSHIISVHNEHFNLSNPLRIEFPNFLGRTGVIGILINILRIIFSEVSEISLAHGL